MEIPIAYSVAVWIVLSCVLCLNGVSKAFMLDTSLDPVDFLNQNEFCNSTRTVVIYDEAACHNEVKPLFMKTITTPETFFQISKENEKNLTNVAHRLIDLLPDKEVTFVMLANESMDIFLSVEQYYNETLRTSGSLLPHRTRWIFLATSQSEQKRMFRELAYSIFDNIVVLLARPFDTNQWGFEIITVSTLMWRQQRRREMQPVQSIKDMGRCTLFPNTQFRLNGRHLKVYVHSDPFYVSQNVDTRTGQVKYQGTTIKVVEYLSRALNFSYEFVIGDTMFNQSRFDHDRLLFETGRADFSAVLKAVDTQAPSKASKISFPILVDSVTGVYRSQYQPRDRSLFLFGRYPKTIYFFFAACYAFVVLLYHFIVDIFYQHNTPLSSVVPPTARSQELQRWGATNQFGRLVRRFWDFGLVIINQPNLPNPRPISARIVIGAWALGNVIIYSLYTGQMTANFVPPVSDKPFKSLKQALADKNYKCGIVEGNFIYQLSHHAEDGVLRSIYDNCEPKGGSRGNKSLEDGIVSIIDNLPDNYVFIDYRSVIDTVIKDNRKDYNVIKQNLMTTQKGFVFPANSGIEGLVSKEILWLRDVGLLGRWEGQRLTAPDRVVRRRFMGVNEARKICKMKLSDFKWLFILTTLWAAISTTVLFGERVMVAMKGLLKKK